LEPNISKSVQIYHHCLFMIESKNLNLLLLSVKTKPQTAGFLCKFVICLLICTFHFKPE